MWDKLCESDLLGLMSGHNDTVLHFLLAAKMGINSCAPPVRSLSGDYSFQRESFTACHSRLMKEFHAEHLAGCLPCTAEEAFAINAKVSNWHFYKNRQSSPLSN